MGYEKGRRTISAEGLAVALIDMQEYYVSTLARKTREKIVRAQKGVMGRCEENDIPLAVVEYKGDGTTLPELVEALVRVPRTLTIQKTGQGGFEGDIDLDQKLKELNITRLLLMGVFASQCVKTFGYYALKRGYEIATARPLIANMAVDETSGASMRNRSMDWYERNGTFYERVPELK